MSAASPAIETVSEPPEAPRSWWQFSLRTMFILVTLLVIGLTWLVNVRSDSEGSSQRFAPPGERISDH